MTGSAAPAVAREPQRRGQAMVPAQIARRTLPACAGGVPCEKPVAALLPDQGERDGGDERLVGGEPQAVRQPHRLGLAGGAAVERAEAEHRHAGHDSDDREDHEDLDQRETGLPLAAGHGRPPFRMSASTPSPPGSPSAPSDMRS